MTVRPALQPGQWRRIVAKNGALGTLKRKRYGAYVLAAETEPYRMRWGTAAQIAKDVAYFVEHGTLPADDLGVGADPVDEQSSNLPR